MIILSCEKLRVAFGDRILFDDLSFSVNEKDKLGIVGANGVGKTTLFRVLCGEERLDGGEVHISNEVSVGILKQNAEIDTELSVYDYVLSQFTELLADEAELQALSERLDGGDASVAEKYTALHERFSDKGGFIFRSKCRGILINLGFDESRFGDPAVSLSGGEKTRLALAAVLSTEPDILMLDEPTNHLDVSALEWLEDYLRQYRKTVIVISHDRYFLDRVTTHILDIDNDTGKLYKGNYSTFAEKKKKDREILEHHYKNQQREIKRIEEYIEQQRRWNRERNIIAAESRQKMLDKMVRIEAPAKEAKAIKLKFTEVVRSGSEVERCRGVSYAYFGYAPLFKNVSFTLFRGDRLFISGKNGCGKSTLIKILAGKLRPSSGHVELGTNAVIGYYDQENQDLTASNTVIDELWDSFPNKNQTEIRNSLAAFNFKGDDIIKNVYSLSGGEKARLSLLKLMLGKHNLLILDEPTNHLDIISREALEDALADYTGTLIAVSHDRYFVNKLATRRLVYSGDTFVDPDSAGANTAKETKTPDTEVISDVKKDYLLSKKAASEQRKKERAIRKNNEEIAAVESRLDEISKQMSDSSLTDHVKLAELYSENEKLEEKLLELYEIKEMLDNSDDESAV